MIDVRMYATLAGDVGPAELTVEARAGLRVRDVVAEAGIGTGEVAIVMINGHSASLDSLLDDGDRVGLFPVVSGG